MAVETVLLALLGVVAAWLAFDAGRERHRLRARMERAGIHARREDDPSSALGHPEPAPRRALTADAGPGASEGWRYWPLTVSTSEDGSIGPRM